MSTASAFIVVRPDDLRTTNQQLDAAVDDIRRALRRLDDDCHTTTLNRADPELDTATFALDTSLSRNRLWSTAEHLEADAKFLTTCATDAEAADRCLPRTEGPIPTGLTIYSGLGAFNTLPKAKPVVDLAVLTGRWAGNWYRAGALVGPTERAVPGAYQTWRAEYLTASYRGMKIADRASDLKQAIGKAPTAVGHLHNRYPAIAQLRPFARIASNPVIRTTTKAAGNGLGLASAALDGWTSFRSFAAGDTETGVVYGLRSLGGVAMLAPAAFPPLAVAGAVVVAGTLVYEYRDHIVDGAEYLLDKHDKMMSATRNAVDDAATAVADSIDGAVTKLFRLGW